MLINKLIDSQALICIISKNSLVLRGATMKNILFIALLLMSSASIAGGCGGDHEHEHEKKEKTDHDHSHDQGSSEEA